MPSLTPLLALLAEIEDPRRAEGKLYRLPHVVLFAILAMVAGANSYRAIHSFIDVHLARLLGMGGQLAGQHRQHRQREQQPPHRAPPPQG